jgi:hypothetical protein
MTIEAIRTYFQEQVRLCHDAGSPFTGELVSRMLQDLDAGGPVAQLIGAWAGSPRADAVAMRLCGALHAATLNGADVELAAEYPAQRANWSMHAVWPLARAYLQREHAAVAAFIRSPPQTNEVARSIALLLGFLTIAREQERPMELLEIGASAGLNLGWERYRYRTANWEWGPEQGVLVRANWRGPAPPLDARPQIRGRAACDLRPPDVNDPAQRQRLRAYIWADQHERLRRFDHAVQVALESRIAVTAADAAEWLPARLAERSMDATTVVYHSVFLQYPPRETRKAIVASIQAAGARATSDAPLAWLRLEPEAMLGGPIESNRMVVDLTIWPGGQRRVLAVTDGHASSVSTLALPAVGKF